MTDFHPSPAVPGAIADRGCQRPVPRDRPTFARRLGSASCYSRLRPVADLELESFRLALDERCFAIISDVREGMFAATLVRVDLALNPTPPMPVCQCEALGIKDAQVVDHAEFLDQQQPTTIRASRIAPRSSKPLDDRLARREIGDLSGRRELWPVAHPKRL
ncbi:hypothetical protein [Sphingosinicella sp. BN140058]|uniref:hypothetical protein n=1 Tax=Sphingosinicella sp. BN140058 TaxID=1892855 RepID=UPI0010131C57|nr:hypothetical protein [Sphingosinicella sp. BN140058]QAY75194.1 hypothetical protein ETR14_00595 [Sphingosinicella sp. BN140058]